MSADELSSLNHELGTSTPVGQFAPLLHIAHDVIKSDKHCRLCCHWSLPLNPPYLGRDTPNAVPLLFHEWLVWHLHCVSHQQLHRRASVGVNVEALVA